MCSTSFPGLFPAHRKKLWERGCSCVKLHEVLNERLIRGWMFVWPGHSLNKIILKENAFQSFKRRIQKPECDRNRNLFLPLASHDATGWSWALWRYVTTDIWTYSFKARLIITIKQLFGFTRTQKKLVLHQISIAKYQN